MATTLTLYKANDQVITLTGITDLVPTAIVGATITGVIVNKSGATVTSAPITFGDVSGAPGTYQGALPASFSPPATTGYVLQITGSHSGIAFYFEVACTVAVRAI